MGVALRSPLELCSMIIEELGEKGIGGEYIASPQAGKGFHWSRITSHQSRNLELRQREPRSRDNAGHSQDFLIFLFRDGRNNQTDIFQELQLAHK